MDNNTLISLEERIAYLERTVDELSQIIARQDAEIAVMSRRLQILMEREATREQETTGGVIIGDEKPPHW